MTDLLSAFMFVAAGVWVYMTGWFFVALIERRNDVADTAWGLGFAAIAAFFAARTESPRSLLVACVVAAWGVRLALHITRRNRDRSEDRRYAQWREEWQRFFVLRTYAQVFLLQGVLMLLVALPIVAIGASAPTSLGALDSVGAAIAITGLAFEASADAQLARFRRRRIRRTRFLERGLWGWSRHPNYFGETLVWWGLWIVSLSTPYALIALTGPVTITLLLTKVSGIPMLERRYAGDPEFEAYKARVSAFIPRPPKREKRSTAT